jgi:dephospho-CoA kinase
MTRVLITGMSGTGKSAVLAELGRRGHRIVDTDYSGWSEEVTGPDCSGPEQLWREDRIDALLAKQADGLLFVGGAVANQGKFYDRFDVVVLLSVPVDVLLVRIETRSSNDFGKSSDDRVRILRDLEAVEPMLRRIATIEIRTDQPLADVVDAVEILALGVPRRMAVPPSSGPAGGIDPS